MPTSRRTSLNEYERFLVIVPHDVANRKIATIASILTIFINYLMLELEEVGEGETGLIAKDKFVVAGMLFVAEPVIIRYGIAIVLIADVESILNTHGER